MQDSPRGLVELWEDFTRDNVTNLVETVHTSATQDISTAKHGGWWTQTITSNEADDAILAGELAWEVDEGSELTLETRLFVTDADKASIFAGMSDANTETAMIIEDEDGTLLTTPDDAFGFMLEGEQVTDPVQGWQVVGVQNTVDNTQAVVVGADTVADSTVHTLRLEANPNSSGTVVHFVDGKLVNTSTSWFRSNIVYCPIVACDSRGTAYTTSYDYIYCCAPRS